MAKVPLPERGQPLDVAYIYQITNALNQLSDQISSATYNYTTVDTISAGPQNIKTSEARIIAGIHPAATNSTVTAATTKEFSYSFGVDFRYPPIVTATPVNTGQTSAGENVSVVITNVTNGNLTGVIRFNSSGDLSIVINMIIVGIPN
jgi:hypothetical protein